MHLTPISPDVDGENFKEWVIPFLNSNPQLYKKCCEIAQLDKELVPTGAVINVDAEAKGTDSDVYRHMLEKYKNYCMRSLMLFQMRMGILKILL
ncbi:MAG: hypothetical protein D6734_04170 [Candidatus Schekmanbacteria bacterium]|nr:MAG: hypothetical protein D6734_04170 [Candidatus Schekmanbacteria bacterium]